MISISLHQQAMTLVLSLRLLNITMIELVLFFSNYSSINFEIAAGNFLSLVSSFLMSLQHTGFTSEHLAQSQVDGKGNLLTQDLAFT